MSILNRLPEETLRSADKAFSWLLVIFGYCIAIVIALDPAGWDDPVFNVVRKVPFMQYSWSGSLAIAVTIYMVGELILSDQYHRRGAIVITGATMTGAWAMAMATAMTRMVYVMPTRITAIWPLIMAAIAVLYWARAVTYANAFTGKRWASNPYQLWSTTFLMTASIAQIIIGVVPSSVFTEVERPVAVQLALVNFMGGAVVMFGLHLRNKDLGMSLELCGACSLTTTLAWYGAETIHHSVLAGTTLGFALVEAFLFGTLHRAIQIAILKYAKWKGKPRMENKMRRALFHNRPAAGGEEVVTLHPERGH